MLNLINSKNKNDEKTKNKNMKIKIIDFFYLKSHKKEVESIKCNVYPYGNKAHRYTTEYVFI